MHALLHNAKAVFFDLDGTLVDSAKDLHVALNCALDKSSLPQVTEQQVRTWIGRGALVLVDSAVQYASTQATCTANVYSSERVNTVLVDFLAFYQNNVCQHSEVYVGVYDLLEMLKADGKHLACITNKPIQPALTLLSTLNLASFFSLTLGGDSLDEKKPSPMPLTHALTHFDIAPADAVMVGDSMFDIAAARAAHIASIGISHGYNAGQPLAASDPTLLIDSFDELLS